MPNGSESTLGLPARSVTVTADRPAVGGRLITVRGDLDPFTAPAFRGEMNAGLTRATVLACPPQPPATGPWSCSPRRRTPTG